jgi:hypothetical protein
LGPTAGQDVPADLLKPGVIFGAAGKHLVEAVRRFALRYKQAVRPQESF